MYVVPRYTIRSIPRSCQLLSERRPAERQWIIGIRAFARYLTLRCLLRRDPRYTVKCLTATYNLGQAVGEVGFCPQLF